MSAAAPGRDSGRLVRRATLYALLVGLALLFLLPLYVVVAGAFKSFGEVSSSSIWSLPTAPSLESFTDSLTPPLANSGGIASGLWNSLVMTIPAVIVSALWGSITGGWACIALSSPGALILGVASWPDC